MCVCVNGATLICFAWLSSCTIWAMRCAWVHMRGGSFAVVAWGGGRGGGEGRGRGGAGSERRMQSTRTLACGAHGGHVGVAAGVCERVAPHWLLCWAICCALSGP